MKIQIPSGLREISLLRDFLCLVGIDEAGRGPFAGPVVAGAVLVDSKLGVDILAGIRDSKTLSRLQREKWFSRIRDHLVFGVGVVSAAEIDVTSIVSATKKAMMLAASQIIIPHLSSSHLPPQKISQLIKIQIDSVGFSTDDLHSFPLLRDAFLVAETPNKGEQYSRVIAAGAIVAKVIRDKIMEQYGEMYPGYGFEQNKGYGTKQHVEALDILGVSPLHRISYKPVREVYERTHSN